MCVLQMFKNNADVQQLEFKRMIQSMHNMSADLKKIAEKSHLLLCDLNLTCNCPERVNSLMKVEVRNIFKNDADLITS
ncbi:hypothetical protein FKM82_029008 [Ascaphus truei]